MVRHPFPQSLAPLYAGTKAYPIIAIRPLPCPLEWFDSSNGRFPLDSLMPRGRKFDYLVERRRDGPHVVDPGSSEYHVVG